MTALSDAVGRLVSCETESALRRYQSLLRRWNTKINLVSPSTLDTIWDRHIIDSAQIFSIIPESAGSLVDLGSGGGLPGVVLSILAHELMPGLSITMIESDQRKAAFLRAALRESGVKGRVLAERIENAAPQRAEVVTARALAPLDRLLPLARRHALPGAKLIFPKGSRWKEEVTALDRTVNIKPYQSLTEDSAAIIVVDLSGQETAEDIHDQTP